VHLSGQKRATRKALSLSNNSSPGPDGIPYGAWKALGDTAVDILHGAFSDLILPEGPELLRRDCPDFNASLLFFLPKKPQAALLRMFLLLKLEEFVHLTSPTATTGLSRVRSGSPSSLSLDPS